MKRIFAIITFMAFSLIAFGNNLQKAKIAMDMAESIYERSAAFGLLSAYTGGVNITPSWGEPQSYVQKVLQCTDENRLSREASKLGKERDFINKMELQQFKQFWTDKLPYWKDNEKMETKKFVDLAALAWMLAAVEYQRLDLQVTEYEDVLQNSSQDLDFKPIYSTTENQLSQSNVSAQPGGSTDSLKMSTSAIDKPERFQGKWVATKYSMSLDLEGLKEIISDAAKENPEEYPQEMSNEQLSKEMLEAIEEEEADELDEKSTFTIEFKEDKILVTSSLLSELVDYTVAGEELRVDPVNLQSFRVFGGAELYRLYFERDYLVLFAAVYSTNPNEGLKFYLRPDTSSSALEKVPAQPVRENIISQPVNENAPVPAVKENVEDTELSLDDYDENKDGIIDPYECGGDNTDYEVWVKMGRPKIQLMGMSQVLAIAPPPGWEGGLIYPEELGVMLQSDPNFINKFLGGSGTASQSESNAPAYDYLFPSDRDIVTEDQLYDFSKEEVALIRNEIFARHGYVFKNPKYKEYFGSKSWYQPNKNFSDKVFNAIEKANIETIKRYEKMMGW
jgi:hypothetical protein